MIFQQSTVGVDFFVFDDQCLIDNSYETFYIICFYIDEISDIFIELFRWHIKDDNIITFYMCESWQAILWKFDSFNVGGDVGKPDLLMCKRHLERCRC